MLAVPGVIDAYVTENATGSPVTIGDVTLAAHSLYVCVAGAPLASAIGQAIWTKKNPGCAYNGSTSVTVYDSNSGYSPPYPSYVVSWTTAAAKPVCFNVTLTNNAGVPSNALTLIQNAMAAAFTGADGGPRARIGSTIYASRFYAGVSLLGSWALIVDIQVGTNAAPTVTFTGAIAGTALTTSGPSGGSIAIGQFVYGAGVATGTIITAGSGSSWTVSVSQTVTSETMTGVAATNNDVAMDIDWVPTFAAGAAIPMGASPDVNLILV